MPLPSDVILPSEEFAELANKDIDNSGMEYHRLFKNYNIGDYFIPGERADVSVITDDSVDRDKEVVDITTINWESYRKNPVVLYGHSYWGQESLPIGKSNWQKLVGKFWKAKTTYAPRPASYPVEKEWFPDTIFDLIKQNFLLGKSIGGTMKRREITDKDIVSHPTWKGAKYVLFDAHIYEYSVVPIQSNTNAVVEVVSKGLVHMSEETLKKEFPAVYELVKDCKNDTEKEINVPIIKGYKTEQDYNNELVARIKKEVIGIQNSIPSEVDNVLSKMLGRV